VRQFPVYVEAPDGQVAAVVSVPDEDPRGVVLTLAGTGRHNLIGSTLCAQLSRRVTDLGLASARLDFVGVGDSPGIVPEWRLTDVGDATREARAVLEEARRALGVERFVVVGTCYGSRVGLGLTGDPGCAGGVFLAPPILDYGGLSSLGRQVGARSSLGSLVRSSAGLRRIVGPLKRRLRPGKPSPRLSEAFSRLPGVRLSFLYGPDPFEDHLDVRAHELLNAALAALTPEQRERFELRMLPWGPLTTFDILSPEEQDEVLDVVVPLVLETLEGAEALSSAEV
jgi:pimeloyl-ACP methyl ester carboxylesterase